MAKFIKIAERIINLDTIAFADRRDEDGIEVVTLWYEQGRRWDVPLNEPKYLGTREDPIIDPLNMTFMGDDARAVWAKLCEMSESWAIPGEIEPDQRSQ